jgi:hypothetical protein
MIVIEQDAQEARDAFAVNTNSALRKIRLADATMTSVPMHAAAGGAISTELHFEPGKSQIDEEGLRLSIDFRFALHDGVSEGQELVRLNCTFEVEYEVNREFTPAEEQIRAFHRGNAVFNCWPFFREFVQNTLLRMTYPPPPIPFLRLMPKRLAEPVKTVDDNSAPAKKASRKHSSKKPPRT